HPTLPSLPTRRSSDLTPAKKGLGMSSPSIITLVSSPLPPLTKSCPLSPTCCVPGNVRNAPVISPSVPAVGESGQLFVRGGSGDRSEEHTSELQSRENL